MRGMGGQRVGDAVEDEVSVPNSFDSDFSHIIHLLPYGRCGMDEGSLRITLVIPPYIRRGELDSLRSTESQRSEGFSKMIQAFAEEAVRGIEAEGPKLRRRLTHLVRDWVGGPEGEGEGM